MTTFVTRAQWGARAAKPGGNKFGAIYGTAVHWEAAPPPALHSACDDAVRRVQAFHMDGRGWNDIAYNLIACDHDYLFEGRQGGTAANGTDFGNEHFPAVCWLGGPGHVPKDGALRAIATARGRLGGNDKPIFPHSHFHPTACPGPFLTTWVKQGAHAPGKPKPPPPVPHFEVAYTDKAGAAHKRAVYLADLEEFFRTAANAHEGDDVPYPVVVTYYPDGVPE